MAYIKRHPILFPLPPTVPTTVAGFTRRYRAETKELTRREGTKARAVLKIARSWTLMQAEQLGEVRFDELRRNLSISNTQLKWHRALAENALKLQRCIDSIPDDNAMLRLLALLDDGVLREVLWHHRHHPCTTLKELKKVAAAASRRAAMISSEKTASLTGPPP
jgi:hypothetical protein